MAKVTEVVQALAQPVVEENGCTLWDVEYVKEAGVWYLRLYIDREGGVSINDCEAISRVMSDKLDEVDPVEGSYTFEVSSAGADRALKKPEHFSPFWAARWRCASTVPTAVERTGWVPCPPMLTAMSPSTFPPGKRPF